MDNGGGCCIARYGGVTSDMSKVNRIMRRFRPIAPKPPGGSAEQKTGVFGCASLERRKRRNTRRCNSKKRKISSDKKQSGNGGLVTLPLLPLTPQEIEKPTNKDVDRSVSTKPITISQEKVFGVDVVSHIPWSPNPEAARSPCFWVVVECVTDTWVSRDMLERRVDLAKDFSPGFVSEGLSRVKWTNAAFQEMAGEGEGGVVVAVKERAAALMQCGAFSCRVRVCGKERKWRSVTVPCDVWRISSDTGAAAFAWRLDVDAALSLGR